MLPVTFGLMMMHISLTHTLSVRAFSKEHDFVHSVLVGRALCLSGASSFNFFPLILSHTILKAIVHPEKNDWIKKRDNLLILMLFRTYMTFSFLWKHKSKHFEECPGLSFLCNSNEWWLNCRPTGFVNKSFRSDQFCEFNHLIHKISLNLSKQWQIVYSQKNTPRRARADVKNLRT